jgi:hypothetical protein
LPAFSGTFGLSAFSANSSLGIDKVDLVIKGQKFTHNINVIDELNDNIICIAFIHIHKLHYNVQNQQVKLAGMDSDQIVTIK